MPNNSIVPWGLVHKQPQTIDCLCMQNKTNFIEGSVSTVFQSFMVKKVLDDDNLGYKCNSGKKRKLSLIRIHERKRSEFLRDISQAMGRAKLALF